MPIYGYHCDKCNYEFDALHKVDDRNKPEQSPCPNCSETECVHITIGTTHVLAGVGTNLKPPDGFKDVLREIKKKNPHNRMDI